MPIKKIYISPERRPAPHGKYWGMDVYEHDVCTEIAIMTAGLLNDIGFEVRVADPLPDVRQRVDEAVSWGADYYLPIHTNASTGGDREGKAQGPEVLAYGKQGGASWNACQLCYARLMAIYPRPTLRGVKTNNTFYEIISTPMLSVYPELAFHDNSEDAEWIINNKPLIAWSLAASVCDWYGVNVPPKPNKINDSNVGTTMSTEQYERRIAELEEENKRFRAAVDEYEIERNALQGLAVRILELLK